MYVGINSYNVRVDVFDAKIGEDYFCPVCGSKLLIKDGAINSKHFAHVSLSDCDDFTHDMSEWHRAWQERFPIENREVVVEHGGEKHRADVLIGKYVLEFQHSPISAAEVERRNGFYVRAGYQVIWVFDVSESRENGHICDDDEDSNKYHWKYANRALSSVVPQNSRSVAIVLQLGFMNGDEPDQEPWLEKIEWAKPIDDDCADYKVFYVDSDFAPDLFSEDGRLEIFLNKKARFQRFLRANIPYKEKCGRVKGHPRHWYLCEKTGDWHNATCKGCPHNLINEYRRSQNGQSGGLFFYCCYPRVIHPEVVDSWDIDHNQVESIRT